MVQIPTPRLRRLISEILLEGDLQTLGSGSLSYPRRGPSYGLWVSPLPGGDVYVVELVGRDEVKEGFSVFLSGFAERHTDVEDLITEGNRVVARHTHHLEHVNEVFGIPPTGQQLSVWGVDIFRFENGKIAEWWVIDDGLGMMQQLGVIPEPGHPEEAPSPPSRPGKHRELFPLLAYSPKCLEKLSGNSYARAKRLTMSRLIAA